MIMIVCVDDNFGMMFNKRRQSRDKKLCEHILKLTQNTNLLMNAYSAKLFSEQQNIVIREDFLEAAQEQDYCFVENAEWLKYQEKITKIILYRWNREYPADTYFTFPIHKEVWKLQETSEIEGNSHSITEEVYSNA